MTNQEKKAWLNRYREAEAQAVRLEGEIERLYAKAERTTAAVSLVPRGGAGERRMEAALGAIEEIAKACGEKRLEAMGIRREIEDAIAAVPEGRLRMLLRYRYIDGMHWNEIQTQMVYEKTQVWRLHGRALSQLKME